MSSVTVAEAGRKGARHRWADHAPVRPYLGDLSNETRKRILTFIEAERRAQEREHAASSTTPEAA
jgi:hypothetical protein